MKWTRSDTIALAANSCMQCNGSGLRLGRGSEVTPCLCVFRTIFRACYRKFQEVVCEDKHVSAATLERVSGPKGKSQSYGRKREEYVADFTLIARRTLTEPEHKLFRCHFLLGADWKLCCRKLGMTRGNFFHAVYRIEQKLGKVFRELEPYALYPLDEYFQSSTMRARAETPQPQPPTPANVIRFPRAGVVVDIPVRPPLLQAA